MLDGSNAAVAEFLSRLPEQTEGASTNTAPLSEQLELLEENDEGFVVPTQVCNARVICARTRTRSSYRCYIFFPVFHLARFFTDGGQLRDTVFPSHVFS